MLMSHLSRPRQANYDLQKVDVYVNNRLTVFSVEEESNHIER